LNVTRVVADEEMEDDIADIARVAVDKTNNVQCCCMVA
jgi:hypothetical protein